MLDFFEELPNGQPSGAAQQFKDFAPKLISKPEWHRVWRNEREFTSDRLRRFSPDRYEHLTAWKEPYTRTKAELTERVSEAFRR